MSDFIKHFFEVDREDIYDVGRKGVNLAVLSSVGFPVSPGFCITTRAYKAFLQYTDLDRTITSTLTKFDLTIDEQIQACGRAIRQMIMEHEIPDTLKEAILPAYWQLFLLPSTLSAKGRDWKLYVTVKSSMMPGALPVASDNDWHESYLNIFGHSALLCSIKKCWALLWTDRAIAYRQEHHIDHLDTSMAVVVQQMLPPEIIGMFFKANSVMDKQLYYCSEFPTDGGSFGTVERRIQS